MKNRTFILITFIFFALKIANGQTEYLIKLDPSTGSYTKIDSISGVKWIQPSVKTFDAANQYFTFVGWDANNNLFLYSVDVNTGLLVSNPSFNVLTDPSDNICNFQYSSRSKQLYAIHWDNSKNTEYFVSINTLTGAFTIIDSIPGIKWINGKSTFDRNNDQYIFQGADNDGKWHLISIDVNTGQIISNPLFPALLDPQDNIVELKYDNLSNKLFGLHWDNSENREYFVSIDINTGTFTIIDSIPGVAWVSTGIYTTLDEKNNRYIFSGVDKNNNWRLYTIDISSGHIISSPIFPILNDSKDNIMSLEADSQGNIYGLHWDNLDFNFNDNNIFMNALPNPFSEQCVIILDKTYQDIETIIYNSLGQVVKRETSFNSSKVLIQRDGLASGLYYFNVIGNHINLGTTKMRIE